VSRKKPGSKRAGDAPDDTRVDAQLDAQQRAARMSPRVTEGQARTVSVRCALGSCGRRFSYDPAAIGGSSFPFCSPPCKGADLGAWVNEEYKVEVPASPEDFLDAPDEAGLEGQKRDPEDDED
jgi:endogenous inhibitor of DNA gyrase (YacG/DUF329 family)